MLRLASRHVASHRRKGRSTWGGSGPGLCYAAAWPPPPRSSSVLSSPATGRGGRKEEGAYLDRAGKDADHAGPELRPSTTTTRKQRRAPLPRQENDDLKLNRKRLPSASPTTCLMKFLNSGSNSLGFPGAEETSQKIKYNYGNYDDYLHTGRVYSAAGHRIAYSAAGPFYRTKLQTASRVRMVPPPDPF